MLTFEQFLNENQCNVYTAQQLKDLEKFADRLLEKLGIDIEFSKHFSERLSDSRNDPRIKISEVQAIFKKLQKSAAQKFSSLSDKDEAVLLDIQSDLNLPFVFKVNKGESEILFKTIMRKKNFLSSSPKITV